MRSEGYCSRSVCVFVCLLSQNSHLERLFVLKILSRTQRAKEVKKFVGFSLKQLRCGDQAPAVCRKARMRIIILIKGHEYPERVAPRVCTLVHSFSYYKNSKIIIMHIAKVYYTTAHL